MQDDSRKALWTERVEQWRASGLSQRAFSVQHGWPTNRLVYWAARFKQDSAPCHLIPVRISGGEAYKGAEAAITLRGPGGWNVMIPAQTDVAWLADLLRRLA